MGLEIPDEPADGPGNGLSPQDLPSPGPESPELDGSDFSRAVSAFRRQLETESHLISRETDELRRLVHDGALESIDPGTERLGGEQEWFLVHRETLKPSPVCPELLASHAQNKAETPRLTAEVARYQIESLAPVSRFEGNGLRLLETQQQQDFALLSDHAAAHDTILVPAGMLLTAEREHLSRKYLTTDARGCGRYVDASEAAQQARGKRFTTQLPRRDGGAVAYTVDSIMGSGQICSFQGHIQCDPTEFVDLYNGFIATAAFALAPAVSSPRVFGQPGVQEMRVHAFEQSWLPKRVFFPHDYANNLMSPFDENRERFEPVFTLTEEERARSQALDLPAVRLLNGSIHRWIRPVYDKFEGKPHIRIELRTLPKANAAHDDIANYTWAVGLAKGFAMQHSKNCHEVLPVGDSRKNFYAVVHSGLDARVQVPGESSAKQLRTYLPELLKLAHTGLSALKVDEDVAHYYLGTIAARFGATHANPEVRFRGTEADWIEACYARFTSQGMSSMKARETIVRRQHEAAKLNIPVHAREVD